MSKNLNEISKEAFENSKNHGFWENERDFGEIIALIHTELSEAYEEYRHGKGYDETYYENGNKPCGIPSEFADVIIRICDFCGAHNIDLDAIVEEKMNYNKNREYKHNKKC